MSYFRIPLSVARVIACLKYQKCIRFHKRMFLQVSSGDNGYSGFSDGRHNKQRFSDDVRSHGTLLTFGIVCYAALMDIPRKHRRHHGSRSAKEAALFDAVRRNSVTEIRSTLATGDVDVNCRHELGWTPLHLAVVSGHLESVKELLTAGADPNAPDTFTNIYDKANELGISSLDVMLWRDADFSDRYMLNTNRTTFRGCTALHYAVSLNDSTIINMLLDSGADPTVENDMGYRPSDYVTNESLYAYLVECENSFENKKAEREVAERLRYPLEKRLRDNLVGQEAAIRTVCAAVRRWQSGWADDEHPLVMLFLGSSGIGKTELAKQVAAHLTKSAKDSSKAKDSDSTKSFIRLDMSEYQERHSVARLIGSPPGYIGHDDGGQLTSKLSSSPNAVVLFDEIEKAHPDVLTVLLQLFDEGRLTDGKGKTIVCTGAIFIMTSNLGSDEIANYSQRLRNEMDCPQNYIADVSDNQTINAEVPQPVWVSKQFKENVIRPILKSHFKRDEFLGRINEFVYFLPFSRRELMQLVSKELTMWKDRASRRHGITLIWDRSVLDILADGYNIHYGARSIKYEVEREVIDRLAAAHDLKLIGNNYIVRIFGSNSTAGDTLLSSSQDSSSGRQSKRYIRMQAKRLTSKDGKNDDPLPFEDIDDKLLMEAIERASDANGQRKRT